MRPTVTLPHRYCNNTSQCLDSEARDERDVPTAVRQLWLLESQLKGRDVASKCLGDRREGGLSVQERLALVLQVRGLRMFCRIPVSSLGLSCARGLALTAQVQVAWQSSGNSVCFLRALLHMSHVLPPLWVAGVPTTGVGSRAGHRGW